MLFSYWINFLHLINISLVLHLVPACFSMLQELTNVPFFTYLLSLYTVNSNILIYDVLNIQCPPVTLPLCINLRKSCSLFLTRKQLGLHSPILCRSLWLRSLTVLMAVLQCRFTKKKKNLWKKKNLPYFLFVNEKKNIPECYLLGWGKNYGLLQTEGDDLPVWDWNQLSVHAYFVPRGQFFKLKWPK